MIDELRLNNKLISFEGIIGRRDYFLNLVYICMINCLFTTPLAAAWMTNVETALDIFNPAKIFWSCGWFLKLWVLIGTAFVAYISISNAVRRLNDINGKVNKDINILLGILIALCAFSFVFPLLIMMGLGILAFILGLVLLFTKGEITKKFPPDFRKEFNWGAFLGTWIWGLMNKSYHTLWIWVLGATPIGFFYQLFCGLKGNEWAYKNRKWDSDTEFKRSQENQTIGFVVLTVFILPIICFILIFTIAFGVAMLAADDIKIAKEQGKKPAIEKFLDSMTSLYFERYEITKNENKFYVQPNDWRGYDFKTRKDMLDYAAGIAEREKYSTKLDELPRTKIYSSVNGELLGEYIGFDTHLDLSNRQNTLNYMKSAMKAYRFYRPTVLK